MQLWTLLTILYASQYVADAIALFLQQTPDTSSVNKYTVMPGIPSANQTLNRSAGLRMVGDFAVDFEGAASEQEQHAAVSALDSMMANLVATNREKQSTLAAEVGVRASEAVRNMKVFADLAAKNAEQIVDDIPAAAKRAEQKAISDVLAATIARMNMEVGAVIEAARTKEALAAKAAMDNAHAEALPFQQAKLRTGQTMVSYARQSQELAIVCNELQKKAKEIAYQAGELQRRGNPVAANQMQTMARDLMDKAQQMQSQAKGLDSTARGLGKQLGAYDLAAQAAGAYGAYKANPGGEEQPLPPLPYPLVLPMVLPGPSPAGSPASSPGPAPGSAFAPAPAPR